MKKLLFLLLTLLYTNLCAQVKPITCGTKVTGKPIIFSQEQKDKMANAINTPYTVRIFVTVFADDNGSNRATTNDHILRQVQNMANHFQPQNICFILGGIRQVNNSDLNNHNADDSTENTELPPFQVSGFLNIFVHKAL